MNPLFGMINPKQVMINMMLQRNPQLNQMWQSFQMNPSQFSNQMNQIKQSIVNGQSINGKTFDAAQFAEFAKQMGASESDINNFLKNFN